MSWLILFFICATISFFAALPFGLINMAVADVAIRKGIRPAIMFGLGAAIVEFFQGVISTKFSYLFVGDGQVGITIQWIAVCIFIALSIYYFFKKNSMHEVTKKSYKHERGWIWKGMGICALNVLPYPFWVFISTLLISNGFMQKANIDFIIVSSAIMFGAFWMFFLYAKFSVWLINKNEKISKYIGKIFAGFFLLLALLQLLRIFLSD